METNARYLVVGAFVLGLILTGLSFVVWIGKSELNQQSTIYDVYFQGSVTGLKDGAQVLYRGVPVGAVQSIVIDPNDFERVRVRIGLQKTAPIREDSIVSIEMQGITGIALIQITGGTPESPPLKAKKGQRYPVIEGKPSKLDEIFEAAPNLLKNLNKLTNSLDLLVNEKNRMHFSNILNNIDKVTLSLSKRAESFEKLINNANVTFQEISKTASEYRHLASNEIAPLLREAQLFLSENKEPLNIFLRSGLYDFSNAVAELRKTLASINRVTRDVERDPTGFLFGTSDQGYELK